MTDGETGGVLGTKDCFVASLLAMTDGGAGVSQ